MAQFLFHKLYVSCIKQPKKCCFGFTLMEIMLAIGLLAVLAAIAIPTYMGYRERALVAATIADIERIEIAIDHYRILNAVLPDSLNDVGLGGLMDPWGNPYEYLRIEGGNLKGKGKLRKDHSLVPVNTDYDLYSKGKDGKSQTPFTAKASQDDIVRANDGGFIGLVSEY
ncbi:MAG: prepilin-type N-terminal cleavage/methylation domain-containing protein [Deltaproteobacteria bacterium]|nr:prepilin-type N-terminal cleavage/methylation domain-containing protein [Deltaproteobacteria bacterium]